MPAILRLGPYRFFFYSNEKGLVEQHRTFLLESYNEYFSS